MTPKGQPGLGVPNSVASFVLQTGKLRPKEAKPLLFMGSGGGKDGAWPHSQGQAPSGSPQQVMLEAQKTRTLSGGRAPTHLAMVSTPSFTLSRSLLNVWIFMIEAATGSVEKCWAG